MLDLERFRLLKAMEDKNTPKKKRRQKFSATSEKKKFCQKNTSEKETSVMDGGRKDLKKKKNVHESHLCKGGLNK